MASLPLNNYKSRDVSHPSLHNPLTQPGAPLVPTSGNENVAVAKLSSNTNHIPPHAPSRPVVTTRDSSDVTSFESLRLAADRGDAHAQYKLGRKYADKRGDAKDYAEAVKYYQLAAEQGFANAQNNLGVMYQKGRGVAQNYAEAVKYCRLAADQGNAAAQYNLGIMYEDAKGVAQNYAEAVKYYQLAADQGSVFAQSNLGFMYANGRSVAQNHAEAVKYYQLAADQGHKTAQWNLGSMYKDGLGVAQSHDKAVKYYRLAADQGDADALRYLAKLYRDGKGVPLDAEKALRYFWKFRLSKNVIDLSGLGITDNLLQHLPRMFEEFGGYGQIKGLPPIIELDLSNNPITDIGAPFIALILKRTQTLAKLFLKKTGITDQGMAPVFDALKNYNISVIDCAFVATGSWARSTLDQLIAQSHQNNHG